MASEIESVSHNAEGAAEVAARAKSAAEHGGHLGFISRRQPRFWLDPLIIEWITEQLS